MDERLGKVQLLYKTMEGEMGDIGQQPVDEGSTCRISVAHKSESRSIVRPLFLKIPGSPLASILACKHVILASESH
ncbi:hypothetical protein LguiA_030356 [Lonicera macranthoides]